MQEPVGIYKPKNVSFGKFIWNGEKGEFLGRTGTSWLKIGVFYVIFYAFLAGFFSAMLAVFYQTLDTENRPTYTPGIGGSILQNPALGFRPRPRKENIESTLIWYKSDDPNDVEHWTTELTNFIKDYEGQKEDGQHTQECNQEKYKERKEKEARGEKIDHKACKFMDTSLGEYCNKEKGWGYNSFNSPCVLLKMNRMIDWEPDVYTAADLDNLPADMPQSLKDTMRDSVVNKTGNKGEEVKGELPAMVWVSCKGENPADEEYLPEIVLTPGSGFPAYYFPYTKIAGYRSPIVAVMFRNPEPNVLINIQCRIWAKNIEASSSERLGMVHFELLRD